MRTETYLRSSLLSPYLFWFVTALILALEDDRYAKAVFGPVNETILTTAYYYTFGIAIWILPYSILAAILWFWSHKQPLKRVIKVYFFSPLIMTVFVSIEILFLSLLTGDGASILDFYSSLMAVGLFAIPFGYTIIGIVAVLYKLLILWNFFEPENEIPSFG